MLYISRHVVFDETLFPFKQFPCSSLPTSSSNPIPLTPLSHPILPTTTIPANIHNSSHAPLSVSSPVLINNSSSSSLVPSPLSILVNQHPMITQAKSGISKPKIFTAIKHNLLPSVDQLTTIPPTPTTYLQASKNPNWVKAMTDEYQALQTTGTWELVPSHPSYNLVGCKWVFKIKHKVDGSIERYKARLVAKGFHQQE